MQQVDTTANIVEIYMFNQNVGWALSPLVVFDSTFFFGTQIFKTINGGLEWSQEFFPDYLFYTITFIDSLHGWMGGEFGALFGTSDGGINWFPANVQPTLFPIDKIRFFSTNYGLASGGQIDRAALIWRTENGGGDWSVNLIGADRMHDFQFVDSSHIIAVGGGPDDGAAVARSMDRGLTWSYEFPGIFGIAQAISFRTSAEAWCPLGFTGSFMATYDTGATWTEVTLPGVGNPSIHDIQFTDPRNGYTVGDSGLVYKFNPTTVSVAASGKSLPMQGFTELFYNYPNPFNPLTTIGYRLPSVDRVTLKVYDLLGREVTTLVDGIEQPGLKSVLFDGSGLASGMYFCRLLTGDYVQTRKLLLVR